ncbi:MAG TPA: glycoside hydrolase family 57 protein [Bryobacteraceae bacterium]|nr:glycoside hydrolase family 57 protein [Bryobacteraceae bacterium]HUI80977.1 glycoside hydrolase family 57 protein [Bryobacteraceae bacterium]
MAQIYLCFLWHMHQPFYKDLGSGEYKLPWTRMHALKDYYGMVQILEEFPKVRQTFNLVPSMMAQVAEYAAGQAVDPFLQVALKPAESLTADEKAFLLRHSFYSDPQRMIYRYPRYGELFNNWQTQKNSGARSLFGTQELRDLQMWSQLAWFDEEFQAKDPEVREWIRRGREFNLADQHRMGEKQREIIGKVLPAYQKFAASGQIEISTTPFYHPILPLLCDSNIASIAHPDVPLPPRFRYPQDARRQLTLAREYIQKNFGTAPVGLWPSEGSVSDEVFNIASEVGFTWAATDSGVLNRTLSRGVPVEGLYRPYQWRQNDRQLGLIFRDHFMSDLIGFVYSKMDSAGAAEDFLRRIRENCSGILNSGRNALVPIILDGENAWEYYDRNGRPFFRELYRRISEDGQMRAVTVSEGLAALPPDPLDHIFPGSWINANFDVWIGADEDNQAWTQLLRARQTFEAAGNVSEEGRRMAFEELLIAEGSDWCWWYGPEHDSANREEFDQLYRSHLANVYRFLNLTPPEELSRPILRVSLPEVQVEPSGPIHPVIDGQVTSYFEWIGAGLYQVDGRSGSMHGKKFLIKEVQFGSDGTNFYVRVDFHPGYEGELRGMEGRLTAESPDGKRTSRAALVFSGDGVRVKEQALADTTAASPVECAFSRVLELRISLVALGLTSGSGLKFQFSLWQGGLPMDAVPQQGWLTMRTTDPAELSSYQ